MTRGLNVVQAEPPMFDRIVAVFPAATKAGTIFTWGDTIYNPSGAAISEPLLAHEVVHAEQQGEDPAAWWERYLNEPSFRYVEELTAHRAEYRAICADTKDRNHRAKALLTVATRLASPLYGSVVSLRQASQAVAS